jgi:hypothetical protein
MTVQCVHFGNIGAWWEPKVLPICAENLTGNYTTYRFNCYYITRILLVGSLPAHTYFI